VVYINIMAVFNFDSVGFVLNGSGSTQVLTDLGSPRQTGTVDYLGAGIFRLPAGQWSIQLSYSYQVLQYLGTSCSFELPSIFLRDTGTNNQVEATFPTLACPDGTFAVQDQGSSTDLRSITVTGDLVVYQQNIQTPDPNTQIIGTLGQLNLVLTQVG